MNIIDDLPLNVLSTLLRVVAIDNDTGWGMGRSSGEHNHSHCRHHPCLDLICVDGRFRDEWCGNAHLRASVLVERCKEGGPSRALRRAAEHGDKSVVKCLVRNFGADPRSRNDYALRAVARSGSYTCDEETCSSLVRFLIEECGADVHSGDDAALRWAARNGRVRTVNDLLSKHGARVSAAKGRALRWAIREGHARVVETLCTFGARARARKDEAVRVAASCGHADIVEMLIYRFGAGARALNDEALRSAVMNGHARVAELLLSRYRADVNACDGEALCNACRRGDVEMAEMLLVRFRADARDGKALCSAGSEMHAVRFFSNGDETSREQLRKSASETLIRMADLLIGRFKADVHALDDETLRKAAEEDLYEAVEVLIDLYGADVHAVKDIEHRFKSRRYNKVEYVDSPMYRILNARKYAETRCT
jgi:hypothetical protein